MELQQHYCCRHKDSVLVCSDDRSSVSGDIIYASILAVLYAPLRWPYGANISHVCLNEHSMHPHVPQVAAAISVSGMLVLPWRRRRQRRHLLVFR